jgi:hemoglobin
VKPVPTLLEWMGGPERLEQLVSLFYSRVPQDPVLAPVFAGMPPQHARHVAAFVAEVFGGAKEYSQSHGGHHAMVHKHVGRALTEAQRQRWMSLLLECADDVKLPADPEFRSAFVAYLEWGTRLAVINSQPDADASAKASAEAPMPRWGWGETGGPYIPGN